MKKQVREVEYVNPGKEGQHILIHLPVKCEMDL